MSLELFSVRHLSEFECLLVCVLIFECVMVSGRAVYTQPRLSTPATSTSSSTAPKSTATWFSSSLGLKGEKFLSLSLSETYKTGNIIYDFYLFIFSSWSNPSPSLISPECVQFSATEFTWTFELCFSHTNFSWVSVLVLQIFFCLFDSFLQAVIQKDCQNSFNVFFKLPCCSETSLVHPSLPELFFPSTSQELSYAF